MSVVLKVMQMLGLLQGAPGVAARAGLTLSKADSVNLETGSPHLSLCTCKRLLTKDRSGLNHPKVSPFGFVCLCKWPIA